MSLATKIAVEDEATPWVQGLQGRVTPHRIAAEVGPRCTRLVQRNFRRLGTNSKGWPSTHFYGRAAEATNWQEMNSFVLISVDQIGIRQRLLGGPIRPVNAKALTIPAQPDTYGKTVGEFSNLQFKMVLDPQSGRIRPALVEKPGQVTKRRGGKRKDGTRSETEVSATTGLVALFWLARGVKQDPDPAVMPSDADFEAELDKSVDSLLREETR